MNLLVTGAAGYIGSVLVPKLLGEGHRVIAVDNFMYQQTSLLGCCCDEHLTVIRGDVRDEKLIADAMKGSDAILPLACLTGAPLCDRDPATARAVNLEAIESLLKVRSRGQAVIFPTTNSGYGRGQRGAYCTEKTSLKPISLYGRLKVEAEEKILEAGNSVTLRLATAFGVSPRMRLDLLVNDLTYRAVTDGFVVLYEAQAKRNYIHVRDVASAFLHVLNHFGEMKGEPYNVGLGDANLSKWELCEEIKKQVPNFYFIESGIGSDPDQRDYVVSNAKIEATGFKPEVSLEQGIAELIRGYQFIRKSQFSNT